MLYLKTLRDNLTIIQSLTCTLVTFHNFKCLTLYCLKADGIEILRICDDVHYAMQKIFYETFMKIALLLFKLWLISSQVKFRIKITYREWMSTLPCIFTISFELITFPINQIILLKFCHSMFIWDKIMKQNLNFDMQWNPFFFSNYLWLRKLIVKIIY